MTMKSIKIMLVGIMIVPAVAFGLVLFNPAVTLVSAVDCDANDLPVGCTPVSTGTSGTGIQAGANAAQGDKTPTDLNAMYKIIANTALFIIGAISVLMLIYGGIRYTTSGGNEKSVSAAKSTIMFAVVGIVVAVLAYAIVNWVIGIFIPTTPV